MMRHLSLWRFSKVQDLKFLFLVILLATFSTSSTFILSGSYQTGLESKTGALLGSDKILSSPFPIPTLYQETAQGLNLKTSESVQFFSMVVYQQQYTLSDVKAVDSYYPLRGNLRVQDVLEGRDKPAQGIPAPGTVWLEPRLLILLNATVGDSVVIGVKSLKITQIISFDTDIVDEGRFIAARALMNKEDLPATGLIVPGSRVTYKLMLAGDKPAFEKFDAWYSTHSNPDLQYIDMKETRGGAKKLIDNIDTYLNLRLIVNIILAASILIVILRNFLNSQLKTIALLKCLGMTQQGLFRELLQAILMIALFACLLGLGLGWVAEMLIKKGWGTSFFAPVTFNPWLPLSLTLIAMTVFVVGFVVPSLLKLGKIPPLLVFQNRVQSQIPEFSIQEAIASIVILFLFVMLNTQDIYLAIQHLSWGIVMVALIYSSVYVCIYLLKIAVAIFPVQYRMSIKNIFYNIEKNTLQISAMTIAVAMMSLLYMIHHDLFQSWLTKIPKDAPNYFVINLQENEQDQFKQFLQDNKINSSELYPVVRGRLLTVNQQPITSGVDSVDNKPVYQRLLNLSSTLTLPKDNEVVKGRWLVTSDNGKPVISIEQGLADRLHIDLGDSLAFSIAEKTLEAKVIGIRSVQWDSFHPNFYVLFPPGVLEGFPKSYMTSFYLPKNHLELVKSMIKSFPSMSLIDVGTAISAFQSLLENASRAAYLFFSITLGFGLLMLIAGLKNSFNQRNREIALLKVLGVKLGIIKRIVYGEFLVIALLLAVISVLISTLISFYFSRQFLHLPFHFDYFLCITVVVVSVIIVMGTAWRNLNGILYELPLRSLYLS